MRGLTFSAGSIKLALHTLAITAVHGPLQDGEGNEWKRTWQQEKKRKKKQHLRKVAELCLEKATSEGIEVAEKIESIEESPERDGEGVM